MENTQILPSSRKGSFSKNNKLSTKKQIFKEYSLLRNNFNPKTNSPNIFINKLELRMKKYYDDICSNNLFNE
jgi:hypothetical protein